MNRASEDVITSLKKNILPLEGFKSLSSDNDLNIGFNPIERSFPNAKFPIGNIHEFLNASIEDISATQGFVTGLLGKLMHLGGACIWISTSRNLFPSALKFFGIEADNIIFVDLKNERDVLYAMHEALKCEKLISVVGEINNINFKESRKLQLAVEQSRVTGFIIRNQSRFISTIACIARWRVTSLPSELDDGMPGVGFPRWNVELLKVRNGKPGSWKIEWSEHSFNEIEENIISIPQIQIRNVG